MSRKNQPDWSIELSRSLTLDDGTNLVTLADARRELLTRYCETAIDSAAAGRAFEWLLAAAETRSFTELEVATDQVEMVLKSLRRVESAGPLVFFVPSDSSMIHRSQFDGGPALAADSLVGFDRRRDVELHGKDKVAEYWAHAAACYRQANASAAEDDKRQWWRMAQSWLGLVRTRERAELEHLGRRLGEHNRA